MPTSVFGNDTGPKHSLGAFALIRPRRSQSLSSQEIIFGSPFQGFLSSSGLRLPLALSRTFWCRPPYLSLRRIHCFQTPILLHLMSVCMSDCLLLNRLDPVCYVAEYIRSIYRVRVTLFHTIADIFASASTPCIHKSSHVLNDRYPYPYQVVCSLGYSFALSPKSVKTESSPL